MTKLRAPRLRALLRPSGPLPRPSWRAMALDGGLALGLALAAIRFGADGQDQGMVVRSDVVAPGSPVPPGPDYQPFLPIEHDQANWAFVMLLVAAPLVVRRRFPLAVLALVLVTATLVTDDHATLRLSFYVCVVAAYSAAVHSPYRVPALAGLALAALLYAQLQSEALPTAPPDSVPLLILLPIAVAADGLRRWRRRADEGHARLSTLEREQGEALRRATELERARIARELHDVVTHNVSVMVIQAGAARKVMDAEPAQARDALLAVEAGGRAAMAELRHVMGLLTPDGEGPAATADLAPQPGLDRLAALVGRVRDTGLAVRLTTSGPPHPVPSGVELAAYRVVQEALTNTVKHAGGASATVLVEYGGDQLRVEVTDTGGTAAASAGSGDGHGLLGLRERLAVYGGTLQAGPRLSGGYRVDARFPLGAP